MELLLPAYDKAVRVAFESDNATDITIQRVGALWTFLHREIELKPGRYTIMGTREGFRDVRREITISAGLNRSDDRRDLRRAHLRRRTHGHPT